MILTVVVLVVVVAAFWLGRHSAPGHDADLAALWRYQRALNDCGHEIDTLLHTNGEALSDTSRDELVAARAKAYSSATALRPEARGLVVRATIPSLADSGFDLADLAHAYLALSERLAAEIVRAQSPLRRCRPFLRDVVAPRVRSA